MIDGKKSQIVGFSLNETQKPAGIGAKLIVIFVIAILIACFFIFDLGRYLNLQFIKENQNAFAAYYQENTFSTICIFMVIYITSAALSLPGAAILTLVAGALFGFVTGTIVVSFASTIGATIAFLVARFLLKDSIQNRYADKLSTINEGIAREGGLYLFTMRLIPAFPFFVVNLVMGLTPLKTSTFYWVSQVGMLAGTMVYVNAGTQLGSIDSLAGILSVELLGSFVLLGLFPLIVKKAMGFFRRTSNAQT
jgi:uncharacterized membrane protein YdjX (TVP38/TMEM64 family)